MKSQSEKDLYFVAVKIFLEDKDGKLFIFKDRFGDWDLPGGRLRRKDFGVALKKVVERKMREELGSKVRYTLDKSPLVFMRHERDELLPNGIREKRRIFGLGYRAKYKSGTIKLGKHHLTSMWFNTKRFKPEKYFTGGWLKGVEDYVRSLR